MQINKYHFQKYGSTGKNYIDDPDDPFICWRCESTDLELIVYINTDHKRVLIRPDEIIDLTDDNVVAIVASDGSLYTRVGHYFECTHCHCDEGSMNSNITRRPGVWCRPRSSDFRESSGNY